MTRRLAFEGAVNFRDLGGYPAAAGRRTRTGRLFRSDNLAGLTDSDLRHFEALGIRVVIDLRVASERTLHADRLPATQSIEVVDAGFMTRAAAHMLRDVVRADYSREHARDSMREQYRRYVTDHAGPYRTMIRSLLRPNGYPALVHCTSGKDRTGFGIAIVLLAVGASRETVLRDYVLTNEFRRDIAHLFGPATQPGAIDAITSAHPDYLEAAFAQIDRTFGSIDAFLARGLGVTDADRGVLRDLLTEPYETLAIGVE